MWNPDLLVVLSGFVVGIIVFIGILLLAGGNLKAAIAFFVALVLGVATLSVEHPNALSILLGCVFIIAGIWLMNVIRLKAGSKKAQAK